METPTCTGVLLKLVAPVHHLFVSFRTLLPFNASGFRFHFTDVNSAVELGGCQQPALLCLVRCGQQLGQVASPCDKVDI